MIFIGFHRISMDFIDVHRIPMDFNGFSMDFIGFQWISMDFIGFGDTSPACPASTDSGIGSPGSLGVQHRYRCGNSWVDMSLTSKLRIELEKEWLNHHSPLENGTLW